MLKSEVRVDGSTCRATPFHHPFLYRRDDQSSLFRLIGRAALLSCAFVIPHIMLDVTGTINLAAPRDRRA